MTNQLKIGTWNLCLGLPNKKDIVTNYLNTNGVSVCCLQETEIPQNFPIDILNCNGFNIELEQNEDSMRVGIYIAQNINYVRRNDLEIKGCHVVIVDICNVVSFRIIRQLTVLLVFS